MKRLVILTSILLSIAAVAAAHFGRLPYSTAETLGFVTGAACVYLVIKQNVWTFPIGIANNVALAILFIPTRLYSDAGLQVVYVILGFHGWWCWLYGGTERTKLDIQRASARILVVSAVVTIAGTYPLMLLLQWLKGSVPFLDAFTTMLSLVAQYLLNRKLIENWYFWMTADVLYVYIYIIKKLDLTAVLYAIFFAMCVAGYIAWRKTLKSDESGGSNFEKSYGQAKA
jgi:nicotinamide mononucleotide transporter